MNVFKYTCEIHNKKNNNNKNINHNKRGSLDLKYEKINLNLGNTPVKKKLNLFEDYTNNKINKHNKISSSLDIYDVDNLNINNLDKKESSFNENEELDENNLELDLQINSIYSNNNNIKKSRNDIITNLNRNNNSYNNNNNKNDDGNIIKPYLTDLNIGKKSMKNIITKRVFLPLNDIKQTNNKEENYYPLTERYESRLIKSKSNYLNKNIKRNSSNDNLTISEENESINSKDENNKEILTTTIRIEDLIVLEEKFSNILLNFKNISQLKKFCLEWMTFYNYSTFFNVFENFFSDSQIKEKNIAHEYSVLEFLSIIVLYEVLKDNKINQSTLNSLNKLIYWVNQNFLIVCDYIISILPSFTKKSSWVLKLNLILEKKKEKNILNIPHLELLKNGNNNITVLMKNILRLYISNNNINANELLFYLSRSSRIFINTLNEYFKKKVNLDEYNINQSDLLKMETKNKNINNKIPYLQNKKDKKKVFTLVLDLDETIISYQKGTFIPRPGLNKFLTEINKLYEIIVFTSATQNYADSILDSIDKNNIYFEKRLYRQHTVFINDTFVKDLSKLGRDLSKIIILDNRPQNYSLQKENGIFIRSFYGDNQYDNALINLIPILKNIAKSPYNDVRKELKKLSEEIFTKVTTDLYDGNYI
jgi:CTD small phosphatase-like protein 2